MSEKTDFDVCIVGGLGYDTNCYLYGDKIDFANEANFTENIDCIGGTAGYSSISFAKLGLQVVIIASVGNDLLGKQAKDMLNHQKINTAGIFEDPKGTKRSVNLVYKDGSRKNFYDGKGSLEIRANTVQAESIISKSRLAHFSVVNWTRYLLPLAKKHNLVISADLQDVVSKNDEYRQDYLEHSEVIFFSAANIKDPIDLIDYYLASYDNIKFIIVGNGSKGCIGATREEIVSYPPVSVQSPVVDTNGAGDALATGFLSSYYFHNYDFEKSILRGQLNARSACSIKSKPLELSTLDQLNLLYNEYK
ncbi:MAG: carbohydrate kinase family protein [Candidatus Kariarchaeaceae archaeon]|jgi:sugar/nucleoside kinase (ribokinase family)